MDAVSIERVSIERVSIERVSIERVSIELTQRCAKGGWFCYSVSRPDRGTSWTDAELVAFVYEEEALTLDVDGEEAGWHPAVLDPRIGG